MTTQQDIVESVWLLGGGAALSDEVWLSVVGRCRPRQTGLQQSLMSKKKLIHEQALLRHIFCFIAARASLLAHDETSVAPAKTIYRAALDLWLRPTPPHSRAYYMLGFDNDEECIQALCDLAEEYLEPETADDAFIRNIGSIEGHSSSRELGLHLIRMGQFLTTLPLGPMFQQFRRKLLEFSPR